MNNRNDTDNRRPGVLEKERRRVTALKEAGLPDPSLEEARELLGHFKAGVAEDARPDEDEQEA